MPNIEANTPIVTQINVFTVPEGGQRALIDGTRVVSYAQSENG